MKHTFDLCLSLVFDLDFFFVFFGSILFLKEKNEFSSSNQPTSDILQTHFIDMVEIEKVNQNTQYKTAKQHMNIYMSLLQSKSGKLGF